MNYKSSILVLSVTCKTEMKEKRQKEYADTSRVGWSRGRVRRVSADRDKSEGQNEDFAATGWESEGLHVHLRELFLEVKPCPKVGRLRCRKRKLETCGLRNWSQVKRPYSCAVF